MGREGIRAVAVGTVALAASLCACDTGPRAFAHADGWMRATVTVADASGTRTSQLDEGAGVAAPGNGGKMWEVAAVEAGVVAVHVLFDPVYVAGPGDYAVDTDPGEGRLQVWIGFPSATSDGGETLSAASLDRVTFSRVGYASGATLAGAFDAASVSRGNPALTVTVSLASFEVSVP